jgi:hypothetical protein
VRGRRCPRATFYRRPRGGERRSSAGAGEVHNAGINVAQRRRRDLTARGAVLARTRSSGGDGAVPNFPVRRGDGEGTTMRGRRCIVREEDDAADRWGWSASERERARERGWQVGLACSRERRRGARERLCAREWAGIGPKGGRAGARERGGGHGMGQIWPSRGEELFIYLFIFYNSFPFLFLFFLNKSFSR